MRILITNDDGIEADGIIRLAKAALKFGEVWVVAPSGQRSASSHSITLRTSIEVCRADFPVEGVEAFAISGTPADCVRVGVRALLPQKPDLILAGINYGYNVGTDVQYSGTIGAAMEGMFQGIRSVAFSEGTEGKPDITDEYLEKLLAEAIDMPVGELEIVSVNIPAVSREEFKGILRDRTVSRNFVFDDHYEKKDASEGKASYMVAGEFCDHAEDKSDLRAVLDGYISIGRVRNIG